MYAARTTTESFELAANGAGSGPELGKKAGPYDGEFLDIEVIESSEGLHALEADWRALFEARHNCPYSQSFDYLSAAWECVARPRGRKLKLVVGRHFGRTVLIWPLVAFTRRHARWLGSEKTEYRDVLVLPSAKSDIWIQIAWHFIRSELGFDWIFLQDVKKDSAVAELLENHISMSKKVSTPSRFLDCQEWPNWDAFLTSRRKKLRSDQRRQWRRLEALGNISFRIVKDADAIEPTITWMLDRKIEWFDRAGLNERSFSSPENRQFFCTVARHAHNSKTLFLATLCLDDTIIAAVYGIVVRGEMTFICFSYDFQYENYSPSRLAMSRMLEWAFDNRLTCVDFMPSTPSYKFDWTNDEFEVSDWTVPCTARGKLIAFWCHASLRRCIARTYATLATIVPKFLLPLRIRNGVRRALLIGFE